MNILEAKGKASGKNKYLIFSIFLSVLSIGSTTVINILIAKEYLRVDRKTQALFGITEILQFGYQYYVVILGLLSLMFAILSFKSNMQRSKLFAVTLLSVFSITIVCLKTWRLFV
jgi:hypothetical protein